MTPSLTDHFWNQYQRFLKTPLVTEMPNPKTAALSVYAQQDLPKAIQLLHTADLDALEKLRVYVPRIEALAKAIAQTRANGHRVFILGCGASGRMAVSLSEDGRRRTVGGRPGLFSENSKIVGIIAGGDAALIRAIEQFEDQADFGSKQLTAQGFTKNDLLIATTASGESPFILTALMDAAEKCTQKPWLLLCNPLEALIARDANHPCQNAGVETFCLNVGPMALTGSTRMQATTAMYMALELALFSPSFVKEGLGEISLNEGEISLNLESFIEYWKNLDLSPLSAFIEYEADCYQKGIQMVYQTDAESALTVLTDVAERAPTFNTPPIENALDSPRVSAPYRVEITESKNAADAWQQLLGRAPFCLNWPSHKATTREYLMGFDVSEKQNHEEMKTIRIVNGCLTLDYPSSGTRLPSSGTVPLTLKLILNIHSTLVMGRLGHYQGNLMTWVSPSNAKLIDRVIRTIQYQVEQKTGQKPDYRPLAERVLEMLPTLKANESMIEKIYATPKT